jgi:hypothetical protein
MESSLRVLGKSVFPQILERWLSKSCARLALRDWFKDANISRAFRFRLVRLGDSRGRHQIIIQFSKDYAIDPS